MATAVAKAHEDARTMEKLAKAFSPYKIRKAPKHLYLPVGGEYTSLPNIDYTDPIFHVYMNIEKAKDFVSEFKCPIKHIFEIYMGSFNGFGIKNGYLCLLCCRFIGSPLWFYSENFEASLLDHLSGEHFFIKDFPHSVEEQRNAENLIYCDFSQKYTTFEIDHDSLSLIEEQMKNTTNCYSCALCSERYATTPSQDVILSHMKRCDYIHDSVDNSANSANLNKFRRGN